MFKTIISLTVSTLFFFAYLTCAEAQTKPVSAEAPKGQFADINGHKMYYERYGQGRPLVLLHGGANSIKASFENQISFFSSSREIIAIEQVGHGHTPNTSAPFSYFQMADDTASLLRSLKIANADLIGWSDGGILALLIARRHPELVHRLVASGANTRLVGMTPEDIKKIQESSPEELAKDIGTGARDEYISTSPDGANHWPTVSKKIWDMWLTPMILEAKDLALISAPALIVSGEKDIIPIEHATEIFKALPKGQFLVLPGTGHHTFKSAANTLNPIISSFINAP
jgi:pimeloyl-ACP methyl ester carboxylesterase